MRFSNHLHLYVSSFIKSLNQAGIDGLLTLQNQLFTDEPAGSNFPQSYQPTSCIESKYYPVENVDFLNDGYALYNWELFFHIPLMIATKLSNNQRFEEARQWFHYIFKLHDALPQRGACKSCIIMHYRTLLGYLHRNYYGKGQPLAFSLAQAGSAAPFAATFKLEGSPIAGIAYAEPLKGQTGSIGSWSITVQIRILQSLIRIASRL